LGVREKEDVSVILSYLYSRGCTKFVLWGRSMGAATAVMFYGAYRNLIKGAVVALILDSPFTSMYGLAAQYASSHIIAPGLLLSPAMQYLRHNVLSKYGFDILFINPLAAAPLVDIPTIVLSGSDDKIVHPALSEELFQAFGGPKMKIFFKGGHNTHRPSCIYEAIRVALVG
jgi:pimeloyl-ACP methyl ester carboxylesterase